MMSDLKYRNHQNVLKMNTIAANTFDASVTSCQESEAADAVVERHDNDVTARCQSATIVDVQGAAAREETAAVNPNLQK